MEYLKPLFADKLKDDDREPTTSFEIPGVEGVFGLYAPKAAFWNQLILVSKSLLLS